MNLTISDLVALIGTMVIVYKAMVTTPADARATEAQTIEAYENTIQKTVDRGLKLTESFNALQKEFHEEKEKNIKMQESKDKVIRDLTAKVDNLTDCVSRLEHQLYSLGYTPVTVKKDDDAV